MKLHLITPCEDPECYWKLAGEVAKKDQTMSDFTLYGDPDQAGLTATTLHEAVMDIVDRMGGTTFPCSIDIATFEPMQPVTNFQPLDAVLEKLDEEYGNPEAVEPFHPTPAMEQAEKDFLAVVLQEYRPWAYEQTLVETIDLQVYLTENVHCSRCGCPYIWRDIRNLEIALCVRCTHKSKHRTCAQRITW